VLFNVGLDCAIMSLWAVAVNILNRHPRTADKGLSSSLGLGEEVTTALSKKNGQASYKI